MASIFRASWGLCSFGLVHPSSSPRVRVSFGTKPAGAPWVLRCSGMMLMMLGEMTWLQGPSVDRKHSPGREQQMLGEPHALEVKAHTTCTAARPPHLALPPEALTLISCPCPLHSTSLCGSQSTAGLHCVTLALSPLAGHPQSPVTRVEQNLGVPTAD